MPKRPLVNISNVTSHQNIAKPTKRSLQNSPQKALKKKPKQTNDRIINDHRDENDFVDATNETKNHLINDPTKSIEKKIRAIVIGTETTQDNNDELVSMDNDSLCESETTALCDIDFSNPLTYYEGLKNLPDNVEDFDKSQIKSVESEPHYSQDIFQYYKSKESDCATLKYLQNQPVLSKGMRAVLVDWMVEVQESFELNHETLYLAVKLVDQYLMREKISKSDFQLVGATAIFIASKFDERIPPAIEDFLYICDDAYSRRDIIMMEMKILKVIDFFLGYPISYRFLRRYARCAKLSMEELTLARFILEMSLMEYELVEEKDSKIAAAALLLAIKMKGENQWSETLTFYSGYDEDSLKEIMYRLNDVLTSHNKLQTIRTKYSHKIFFEVAKIAPLPKP